MCDCFYLHGQTGGRDSVGSTVFVHNPSTLLDREPSTRPVPYDWAGWNKLTQNNVKQDRSTQPMQNNTQN